MENFLNNSINSIRSLLREFFCFKTFKKLPLWLALLLFVLELPLLLFALFLTTLFYACWAVAYLQNIPAMTLSKIIKSESKDLHFGSQIVIYFVCYSFIFLFYLVSSFMMPLLYVLYFFISGILFICSGAGIKYSPNLAANTEREIVDFGIKTFLVKAKEETEFSLPVFLKTIVFAFLFALVLMFNNAPSLIHGSYTTLFGLFDRGFFANSFVMFSFLAMLLSFGFDLFKNKKASKITEYVSGGLLGFSLLIAVWNLVQMFVERNWKLTYVAIVALVVDVLLTAAIFVSAVLFEKIFKTKK